jgi:uncharacterized protein (DUF983 family)
MKNQKAPLAIIIASLLLIIINFAFATTQDYNWEFWLRILSSALIILAMVLTIRDRKKKIG